MSAYRTPAALPSCEHGTVFSVEGETFFRNKVIEQRCEDCGAFRWRYKSDGIGSFSDWLVQGRITCFGEWSTSSASLPAAPKVERKGDF